MQIIKTSVIENIKHNFEELFPAEKKTAQYILDHLEEVTLLNISQLAKKAHASEASNKDEIPIRNKEPDGYQLR